MESVTHDGSDLFVSSWLRKISPWRSGTGSGRRWRPAGAPQNLTKSLTSI